MNIREVIAWGDKDLDGDLVEQVVVTKGKDGADKFVAGNDEDWDTPVEAVKGIKITPIDTCGAGDAFLAAYALSGSLEFSNLWGGLSCLVKGANPPSLEMLEDWIKSHE